MRLSEITFNTTGKSATTRYDFDEFINNAEFTGKVIGNYELWIGRYGTGEALLVKSDDEIDPGFLGAMYLLKSADERYYHTEIMFDPEIQGKGLAVPMYLYVLQEMGLTIMSDRTQTPGGAAIWQKLAEMPGVNVYIYNTTDNSFHGEYDPKDSGRVYGPEDWRHKIRLVATTDTITSVDEAMNGIGHPDLLTMPQNTLVIDTPGDLDWYKIGQHFPTLDQADPREFGAGDSDMVITFASDTEKKQFEKLAARLGLRIKDIGGTATHPEIHEAWSEKYKKSINCSNPKGFSQKAHCAGRKKKTNESVDIPDADDDFFKRNRFKRTEYGGMKIVYGYAYDLFQIYAYSAYDQAMGAVMFRYDSDCDCYQADDVFVETRFRRQGVATAMYDFAKSQLDAPIKPSTAQTDKGAAFWGKKEVWEAATPDDIFYMISDIHTGHNDIETDEEFQQWVGSFDKYELKDIPLSKLKVSQSNINADKAKSYIKQKNPPPIVVDGTNYWIIDGHHRVAAALARGDKTIKGYVGLNELAEGDVVQFNRQSRLREKAKGLLYAMSQLHTYKKVANDDKTITYVWADSTLDGLLDDRFEGAITADDVVLFAKTHPKIDYERRGNLHYITFDRDMDMADIVIQENFHDGKKKGKSKPGRVKRAGASCQGSVSHLRAMAKKYDGERGKMYHWCANMKSGKKKK